MVAFLRAVLLAIVVGIGLGVAGQTGSDLHPGMRWVVALGAPWLVTAFVAGALVGDRARGAVVGAGALVVGTLVYYAIRVLLGAGTAFGAGPLAAQGAAIVAGWCTASVGGGAAFGFAGAAWRRGGSVANVVAAAVVGGALVGEGLLLAHEWSGRGPRVVLGAEIVAGALAPFVLTRRRALIVPALALTVLVALGSAATEDGVRHALRAVGWNGA